MTTQRRLSASPGTPALSVVIALRDVELYVRDMLAGLSRNVRSDFEFLIVDDGSTDNTPQMLADARLPGLTVITNPAPVGPSAARNAGLAKASGRYITFLDGDDWPRPGYYADLVAAIEGLACDFIMSDHIQVRGRTRIVQRPPEGRRQQILPARAAILPHHEKSMVDYPYTWAGIYTRPLADAGLLTFNAALHTAEDRPWFWRLYRHADNFAVVSLQGIFYRRETPRSLTAIGDARQLHFFDAFDQVLSDLEEDPDYARFHYKAIRNYCAIIAHHLAAEDRLSPRLRRTLRSRARSTMLSFPAETLAAILRGSDEDRRALFGSTLGISV